MTLRKRQRMMVVMLALLLIGGATGLVLTALQDKVAFFVTPSEIVSSKVERGRQFRLGGLVAEGSVRQEPDGSVRFAITDLNETVTVAYRGILPDLFRERQGIVAQGRLGEDGTFEAVEVLAKHDENYMPKEVADALKSSGVWHEEASP
jgi:cytochrome c-type biogenesis protein CcmE